MVLSCLCRVSVVQCGVRLDVVLGEGVGFYELGRCMVGIMWVCGAVWRVCYGIELSVSCECSAVWCMAGCGIG